MAAQQVVLHLLIPKQILNYKLPVIMRLQLVFIEADIVLLLYMNMMVNYMQMLGQQEHKLVYFYQVVILEAMLGLLQMMALEQDLIQIY